MSSILQVRKPRSSFLRPHHGKWQECCWNPGSLCLVPIPSTFGIPGLVFLQLPGWWRIRSQCFNDTEVSDWTCSCHMTTLDPATVVKRVLCSWAHFYGAEEGDGRLWSTSLPKPPKPVGGQLTTPSKLPFQSSPQWMPECVLPYEGRGGGHPGGEPLFVGRGAQGIVVSLSAFFPQFLKKTRSGGCRHARDLLTREMPLKPERLECAHISYRASVAAPIQSHCSKDKCENQLSDASCPRILQDSDWYGNWWIRVPTSGNPFQEQHLVQGKRSPSSWLLSRP